MEAGLGRGISYPSEGEGNGNRVLSDSTLGLCCFRYITLVGSEGSIYGALTSQALNPFKVTLHRDDVMVSVWVVYFLMGPKFMLGS